MKLHFFDDGSAEDIPNLPGVYAFFYRGLSSKLFGFIGNQRPISAVRSIAKKITTTQLTAFTKSHYIGEFYSDSQSSHIRPPFNARLESNAPGRVADQIAEIDDSDLKGFIELMSASAVFQRPLYVGITTEQTLAERYLQHRQAYYQSGIGFGSSVKNAGFVWSNLIFGCIPYEDQRLSSQATRTAERLIQSLSSPIFSKQ